MKHRMFILMSCLGLVFLLELSTFAAPPAPGSPEAVLVKAIDALNHGRIDEFVAATHPEQLNEFRNAIGQVADAIEKGGNPAKAFEGFEGITSVQQLRTLDGAGLLTAVLRKMTSNREVMKIMATSKIDVIGRIAGGKNTVHVVYRSTVNAGGKEDIVKLIVGSMRRSGSSWKMVDPGDLAGGVTMMKQGIAGKLALPDLAARRVEPLGHVLDGSDAAMIVYRSTIPVGDASISQLEALSVSARDPAFKAVVADKKPEVKALLEDRLGIKQIKAAAAIEKPAAPSRRAAGVVAKATPRAGRTPGNMRARTNRNPAPEPAAAALPEGLVDLPATFSGGNRDRFHDFAPEGGVLVGARVSYIQRFGGPKVSSIQPIYRVGGKLVDGKRQGGLLGTETTAVAKPGYAVGGLNTHTGLTVDGFEMVFMRIEGDHLDTADSYRSPWLGDIRGGSPRDVSTEGKIPVGLQGRAAKELNALGLIVGK